VHNAVMAAKRPSPSTSLSPQLSTKRFLRRSPLRHERAAGSAERGSVFPLWALANSAAV